MISQITQLETKIKDQDYKFFCPPNSSLNDCLTSLDTFRFYIIGRIKEVEDQSKAKEEKKEEPKPEGTSWE